MEDSSDLCDQPGIVSRFFSSLQIKYQYYLDRIIPYTLVRWIIAVVFIALLIARMFHLQGFYRVPYTLYFFDIYLFVLFLTPDVDGPVLPSKGNDEFRPFIRLLSEFTFWRLSITACILAICCTFFEFFNAPASGRILALYSIFVFFLLMAIQIMLMIKYRYIPFTVGKPKMAGKEDSGKVVLG